MHNKQRRAAAYLRTSTTHQHLDAQAPAVMQLIAARGFELVATFEEQVSATAKHRPAWEALRAGAHRGDFEVVVVAAIDRIGRSLAGNVQEILALDQLGVEVVSVREPWLSTQGPVRSLLVAIFSWVAEEERRQIADRSKAGVERARRAGKTIGRPKIEVDVTAALELRTRGFSVRATADKLGVAKSTLQRALRSVPEVPPQPV